MKAKFQSLKGSKYYSEFSSLYDGMVAEIKGGNRKIVICIDNELIKNKSQACAYFFEKEEITAVYVREFNTTDLSKIVKELEAYDFSSIHSFERLGFAEQNFL